MKILHVVRQFYPMIGGLENYIYNLAKEQIHCGHEVSVATLNRGFLDNHILSERESINDIAIIRIPFWGSHRYPIALSITQYLKEFDIVHVHAIDFFADFLALTKPFHRKKLILTTHGGFFHTTRNAFLKRIFFYTITRVTLRRYKTIIACSQNDYMLFSRISSNIKLVNNGAEVQKYIQKKKYVEPGRILTVGRIDQHKGIDKLIRIVDKLRERGTKVKLEIIGPDSRNLKRSLLELTKELGLEDYVIFRGKVSEEELIESYSRAHIFVSASSYEGFGIVAVEALASGTLCLLNDIPSYREILNGQDFGAIADFNETEEVVKNIEKLLHLKTPAYRVLSDKARAYAQKYDWRKVAVQINNLYD